VDTVVVFCRDCSRPFDAPKRNRVPELCVECKREINRVYLRLYKQAQRAVLG
jgi:hypothetical protein